MSGRSPLRSSGLLPYLVACALLLPFVLPVLWTVMASLSTNNEITLNALRPPSQLRFENYSYVWTEGEIGRFVGNSLVISVSSAILIGVGATLLGDGAWSAQFPGSPADAHRGHRGHCPPGLRLPDSAHSHRPCAPPP